VSQTIPDNEYQGHLKDNARLANQVNYTTSNDGYTCRNCWYQKSVTITPRICNHKMTNNYAVDGLHKCNNYKLNLMPEITQVTHVEN